MSSGLGTLPGPVIPTCPSGQEGGDFLFLSSGHGKGSGKGFGGTGDPGSPTQDPLSLALPATQPILSLLGSFPVLSV